MPRYRKITRLCAAVAMMVIGGTLVGAQEPPVEAETSTSSQVVVLSIANEIITPTVAEYIDRGIAQGEKTHAAAVVIELDTPGGLLASTQDIVQRIMNAKVPVVVYVSPTGGRAASAGVFITMAAHVAAMAPSTRIGAAHPVTMGGKLPGGEKPLKETKAPDKSDEPEAQDDAREIKAAENPMGDKIVQDTVAWVKGIAEKRGRNVEWAVESVVKSRSSTAEEALELTVIDVIEPTREALLQAIDGRAVDVNGTTQTLQTKNATVLSIAMTARQQLLQVISNPNIAYILMMLGFYGLLFEITHPGSWIPGIAGAICLILAFYAMQTLPTNYAGLAFIVLSIILFLAEVKVTSYGFLTLAGLGCLIFGSIILIDSPAEFMQISLKVILPFAVATAGVAALLVSLTLRSHRAQVAVGVEGMVGRTAIVSRALDLRGKVEMDGEIWDAEAQTAIAAGAEVEVVAVKQGMRLEVRTRT